MRLKARMIGRFKLMLAAGIRTAVTSTRRIDVLSIGESLMRTDKTKLLGLWRARRRDTAALSVIIIFFTLFFGRIIFAGKFFVMSDSFIEIHPERVVAWNMIRHGQIPLWTPLLFSGYPLLSMAQIGIGYPLTWFYLFLPAHWAEEIYVLAPFLLSPSFTYAYAREIGRSRTASVLAGLTFGYGGMMLSPISNNGLMPNAILWLPLMLIAIERARERCFVPTLLLATGAYAMSVLSGTGQGFVYVGAVSAAYALFTSVFKAGGKESASGWLVWDRWRPLAVTLCAVLMSAGVAAFQILETLRAQRRSVRAVLSYEVFSEGSFPSDFAVNSLVAPLYYVFDVASYVPLLSLVLAIFGVVYALKERQRDARLFFWLATALIAWVLMLGANTPLYPLVYHVPFINRFRVPSRHAFEWTFAVGILAAYGLDAGDRFFSRAKERLDSSQTRKLFVPLALLLCSITVGALWCHAANVKPFRPTDLYTGLPESIYLRWKTVFTLLAFAALWSVWRIGATESRTLLLIALICTSCFVEPYIEISRWFPGAKPASRFKSVSPATSFLLSYAPNNNRVYTGVKDIWLEENRLPPRLDAQNRSMVYGLQNAAGYEPLIFERYSRALGNVGFDAVNPRSGFPQDLTIYEPRSRVFDILNIAFVVTYATGTPVEMEKDGIGFSANDLRGEIKSGRTMKMGGEDAEGDTLVLVTSMANSAQLPNHATVAKVRVYTSDGRIIERELRAGVDTSEWAHERPDVRDHIRHSLASIFSRLPGDNSNIFPAYRYWSRTPLGDKVKLDHVEVSNTTQGVELNVWKASLHDSQSRKSTPLALLVFDSERWQRVYQEDEVVIYRNLRVLPRAWLVAEAEAVDGEEALKRIRGESTREFDPARTALLEVQKGKLPALPGGAVSSDATARITNYEPNRITIETKANTPTVLVLSEINYPGWEATLDGAATQIHAADFLLRGIALPAGSHRVEMRYTAPAARNGAFISLFTLLLIGGLAVYARRNKRNRPR